MNSNAAPFPTNRIAPFKARRGWSLLDSAGKTPDLPSIGRPETERVTLSSEARGLLQSRRFQTSPSPLAEFLGTHSPRPGDDTVGKQATVEQKRTSARLSQHLAPELRESAQRHFPYILDEAKRQGVTDKAQLAYILATATHESRAGLRRLERASGRAYENREDLGNTEPGDGPRFKGRGYVQLTGRANYEEWSERLGIDLVRHPERAQEPRIAAQILVQGMLEGTFTGARLGDSVSGQEVDFVSARSVVNGSDRADHIAGIAQNFLADL